MSDYTCWGHMFDDDVAGHLDWEYQSEGVIKAKFTDLNGDSETRYFRLTEVQQTWKEVE